MTKNKVQKELGERVARNCGGWPVSVSALAAALGDNRKYVADVRRKAKAERNVRVGIVGAVDG